MKIELYYFEGCPGFRPSLSLLQQVLDEEGVQTGVQIIPVESEESAVKYRFLGSPSIRVDGRILNQSSGGNRLWDEMQNLRQ